MSTLTFVTVLALLAAVLLAVLLVRLEARVAALTTQLGARVGESAASSRELTALVGRQVDGASRSARELADRIARLDEATRQVERVGRSVAGLEQILASPKRRGGLGEWSLELLLEEALPAEQIQRQHRLASRDVVVDIAVRVPDGHLVAIDSKFPLEAYRRLLAAESDDASPEAPAADAARRELQRAVRARVDEVAAKYISPEDGTLDFALMFIPSEGIYYELAVRGAGTGVHAYGRERRVHLCSPNTLYAYLQSLALGLRGVRIAEHARRIHATLDHLRQDVAGVRMLLDRAATQLGNAAQNVTGAGAALGAVEARLERIADVEQADELGGGIPPAATDPGSPPLRVEPEP
ncbi:MAG: DNA recombination protein RmuC [Longimicrobiales bacterium]